MDPLEADVSESTMMDHVKAAYSRKMQHFLDKSTVWPKARWGSFFFLLFVYMLRVWLLQGWYIITYGLGIYLLNLFIGFLSPEIDPESHEATLPGSSNSEYRPFQRRVPEFKFWTSCMRATLISLFMTFFNIFNIPVFWPILLMYFCALFFLTMKRQIKHMWKHKYVPWSGKKKQYKTKEKLETSFDAAQMGRVPVTASTMMNNQYK